MLDAGKVKQAQCTLSGRRSRRSEASTKSSLPMMMQKAARRASVLMRWAAASLSSSAPPGPCSPAAAAAIAKPFFRGCSLSASAMLGNHQSPYSSRATPLSVTLTLISSSWQPVTGPIAAAAAAAALVAAAAAAVLVAAALLAPATVGLHFEGYNLPSSAMLATPMACGMHRTARESMTDPDMLSSRHANVHNNKNRVWAPFCRG